MKLQKTYKSCNPPGLAKEDWKIIAAIRKKIEKNFSYYDIYDVRKRLKDVNPQVFNTDKNIISNKFEKFGKKGKISEEVFHLSVNDFYLRDPISKSSKTILIRSLI